MGRPESITVDVAIIGGGIAGSALAAALAGDGLAVLLLERQKTYRDKVRGEVINCWGVAELLELGLEKAILKAGGTYVNRFVGYDEAVEPEVAEAAALHLDQMVTGIPGVLDVGHPEACQALSTAAAEAGATVLRGVDELLITAGDRPGVRFTHDNVEREVFCRLVIGADGRTSSVRRQVGIALTQTPANSLGGGLLVEDLHDWPVSTTSIGTEGDLLYFVFPRSGARARLYLLHDTAQRGRFAGTDRQREFLEAFRFKCIPNSGMFAAATPSESCAFYPMNDSWTDEPYAPGAVLMGDAAGWSDPIVGQGLSVALRDARMLRDALRESREWTVDAFARYRDERAERMARLRVSGRVRTTMNMTFTPEGVARRAAYAKVWPTDPLFAGSRLATFMGPFGVEAESFAPDTIARIFALG